MSAPDTPKMPNGNSSLQKLPRDRQDHIFELLETKSIREVVNILREDGFETSRSSLSRFWNWYQLRESMEENEALAESWMENIRTELPGISEEQVSTEGRKFFNLLAMKKKDDAMFNRTERTRQRDEVIKLNKETLAFDREKFEFDATKKCQEHLVEIQSIQGDTSLDDDEKVNRIRMRLFGSTPK